MFQTRALPWTCALVIFALCQMALPDPQYGYEPREIGIVSELYHLFGGHHHDDQLVLKPAKTNFYSTGSKSGSTEGQSGWPLVDVKFNHPIQSPVDLLTSRAVTLDLPTLNIVKPAMPGIMSKVYNSGHTVYVYIKEDPKFRPSLVGGPLKHKFIFEQMHFHWGTEDVWGSEHFVDGESFAIEIHMVHYNSKYENFTAAAKERDGLAVLTVFAEGQAKDNELLTPLCSVLPQIAAANTSTLLDWEQAMQWPVSSMGKNDEYYTYPGSLTTPPYSENVVFILLLKPITLSHNQLAAFRSLHSDHEEENILENKRQVQPLHNRPIIRSKSIM